MTRMIQTNRLYEFVTEVVRIYNRELDDETRWDLWLHKVFDMEFAEFLRLSEEDRNEPVKVSQEDLETTVRTSMGIINGFCPS